jgi:arsenical pump membrane protein
MTLIALGPRAIPSWVWPVAGAALLVILRAEPVPAALHAIAAQWNVLLFILGLMVISAAADSSGLFNWVADTLVAKAQGSRRRLFTYVFASGALLTAVMANDTTAIVFTPIVYRAVAGRGIDALPYLFACTFVADTASFGLPFSNPANLLVLPRPHFIPYVVHLGLPAIIATILNCSIFVRLFARQLHGRYEFSQPPALDARSRRTLIAMLVVAAGYIVAMAADVPLGPIAAAGAILVLIASNVSLRQAGANVGWSIFVLLGGLFVLLDAVVHQGAVSWALHGLHEAAHGGRIETLLAAAFGAAIAANLLNNLPVAAMSGTVVAHSGSTLLGYPFIAGIDLGPNLTTTGSLATILWLSIVRQHGVKVNPIEYLRLGLAFVPAALLVTCLWLWIVK